VNGGNTPLSRYAINVDFLEFYWAYKEAREWHTKDKYLRRAVKAAVGANFRGSRDALIEDYFVVYLRDHNEASSEFFAGVLDWSCRRQVVHGRKLDLFVGTFGMEVLALILKAWG